MFNRILKLSMLDVALLTGIVLVYFPFSERIPMLSTIVFWLISIFFLFSSGVYAFFFAFFTAINITNSVDISNYKLSTTVIIFSSIFFKSSIKINPFNDHRFKKIFILGLAFSLYWVVSYFLKSPYRSIGDLFFAYPFLIFGFLVCLPAYIHFINSLPVAIAIIFKVAILYVFSYYLCFFADIPLFYKSAIFRNEESDLIRYVGADLRSIFSFLTIFIPLLLSSNTQIDFISRIIYTSVFILILGVLYVSFMRLEGFYTLSTLFLVVFLFYINNLLDFKRIYLSVIFVFFAVLPIIGVSNILEVLNIINWSFGSLSGTEVDTSVDTRLLVELPFLWEQFQEYPFFGVGLENLGILEKNELGAYAFVDIPILGSLAAYGIIGMSIYYIKIFTLIRLKPKMANSLTVYSSNVNKSIVAIWAYILGMLLFRFFHISFELVFDYRQVEYGLIIGLFLALYRIKDRLQVVRG